MAVCMDVVVLFQLSVQSSVLLALLVFTQQSFCHHVSIGYPLFVVHPSSVR